MLDHVVLAHPRSCSQRLNKQTNKTNTNHKKATALPTSSSLPWGTFYHKQLVKNTEKDYSQFLVNEIEV